MSGLEDPDVITGLGKIDHQNWVLVTGDDAMPREHGDLLRAIDVTVATVDGVTGDTAKPRASTLEVTGDFEAGALVKALNAAGFSAQVTQ